MPAVGYLVGDVHNGIAQMFTVIEHARMTIGVKAAGTLSTGYLNALAYAKERVQGADLTQMTDKTAPRVTIMHHPDVRRSLMTQKAYAEGLRALYLYAAAHQDDAVAQQVSGADHDMAHRVDDLLLPIVKGVSSERAYEILTESLQTLGGSGFLQDYPLEQYIRDSKIDSLYEGTTAIQALDFFFRKIVRDHGQALQFVTAQISQTIDNCDEALKPQALAVQTALDEVTAMTGALTGYLMSAAQHPTEIYKVGLGSVRYLLAVGDLLIGWRLLVHAGIAHAALADSPAEERRGVLSGQDRDLGVLRQEHAAETDRAAPRHRVHRRRCHAHLRRRVLTCEWALWRHGPVDVVEPDDHVLEPFDAFGFGALGVDLAIGRREFGVVAECAEQCPRIELLHQDDVHLGTQHQRRRHQIQESKQTQHQRENTVGGAGCLDRVLDVAGPGPLQDLPNRCCHNSSRQDLPIRQFARGGHDSGPDDCRTENQQQQQAASQRRSNNEPAFVARPAQPPRR